MARAGLCFLALFLVAACTTPTGSPRGVSSLRGVQVILTSSVKSTPFTSEQLALPGAEEIIQQCKRAGGTLCDTNEAPTNDLSEFDRAVHSEVNVLIRLAGPTPGIAYEVEWKLFNPNDDLIVRYEFTATTPSNWSPTATLNYWYFWKPIDRETWQLGDWAIEIFVNGKLETRRSYTVVDSG